MQKITPFLWFDTQAEEAANFYTSIFPNSKIGSILKILQFATLKKYFEFKIIYRLFNESCKLELNEFISRYDAETAKVADSIVNIFINTIRFIHINDEGNRPNNKVGAFPLLALQQSFLFGDSSSPLAWRSQPNRSTRCAPVV